VKIAYLSHNGDSLDIAFRMALDNNKVTVFVEDPQDADNFDGLIPKAKTWQEAVNGKDLLVFDDNKMSPTIWNSCHKSIPCFGGSPFGARLEKDRAFAHSLMSQAGIPTIESISFKTLKEVIPHLKTHKVPHVIKPQGKQVKSHHLIVGKDPENSDAISQVERLIEQGLIVEAVEVEEKKNGVETGLSIFFNGMERVGPVNVNFEHKRSHDGERGFLTGEMGTLIKYCEDPDLPLYKDTLEKMIPILRAYDYRGQIDLNMIVNDDGAFPLEFTPRPGKPSIFIEDEVHITPWGELMHGCATGKNINFQCHYDWAIGVQLCAFGFPFREQAECSKGLVIDGLDEHTLDHLHPIEAKLNKNGKFVVDSGVGEILCATGRGDTIDRAKIEAYRNLGRVTVPNSFYRHDISDKISAYELDRLNILPLEESVA
jgi:phosphoribosylamine--glycine ligase